MIITRQKSVRRLAVLALFAILAVAAYGFAASNTVPDSYAGDGQNDIDGFVITNVDYDLDDTNPYDIAGVTFDISPAPGDTEGEVFVEFLGAGPGFAVLGAGSCSISGTTATCSGLTVNTLGAEYLRVIAAE